VYPIRYTPGLVRPGSLCQHQRRRGRPHPRPAGAGRRREVRAFLCEILEHEGYRTRAFESGSHALEFAPVERPALVLLDIYLVDLDGYTVASRQPRTLRSSSSPGRTCRCTGLWRMASGDATCTSPSAPRSCSAWWARSSRARRAGRRRRGSDRVPLGRARPAGDGSLIGGADAPWPASWTTTRRSPRSLRCLAKPTGSPSRHSRRRRPSSRSPAEPWPPALVPEVELGGSGSEQLGIGSTVSTTRCIRSDTLRSDHVRLLTLLPGPRHALGSKWGVRHRSGLRSKEKRAGKGGCPPRSMP
jgi:hypothetical protein